MPWSTIDLGYSKFLFLCKPWMGRFLLALLQAQIIPPLISRANHGTCRVSFRKDPSAIAYPQITPQGNMQDFAYYWPISRFCGVREYPDPGDNRGLGIVADRVIMIYVCCSTPGPVVHPVFDELAENYPLAIS